MYCFVPSVHPCDGRVILDNYPYKCRSLWAVLDKYPKTSLLADPHEGLSILYHPTHPSPHAAMFYSAARQVISLTR